MKKNIKTIIKYIIFITLVIVFSYFYSRVYVKHSMYDTKVDNVDWVSTGNACDKEFIQTFNINENHINGIQVQLDMIGNDDTGKLNIELCDNLKSLTKKTISFNDIQPGRLNYIYFDKKISIKPNHNYIVKFTQSVDNFENGLSYYYTNSNIKYRLYSKDKDYGNMIFRTLSYRFNLETFIICVIFILFIFSFMKILFKLFKA